MRLAARTDSNQVAVIAALRAIGCTVKATNYVGMGFPDVVAGYRGVNFLIEVKDGDKSPSKQKLTPDEAAFHAGWRGSVLVVTSPEDAVAQVKRALTIPNIRSIPFAGDAA